MPALDGEWDVRRTSGLLPPLVGIRKRIAGARGATTLGPLPLLPFAVRRHEGGASLIYVRPFSAFVDVVDGKQGDRYEGRATFLGHTFGRFVIEKRR